MNEMNDVETVIWRLGVIGLFLAIFIRLDIHGLVSDDSARSLAAALILMAVTIILPAARAAMSLSNPISEMSPVDSEGDG